VLAQPDLGARTRESESQFDSYYDARNTFLMAPENQKPDPASTISQPCRPSHNETLVEEQ
jgi:hypothetical protein